MNLYQFDMNLLVIFDMIYTERHLTRAGEKLRLSQPAMSQALGRLRDMFEDPLFVRAGKQMTPTARAKLIAPQIKQVLHLAEQTLMDRGDFDPQTSTRTFTIAMSDYTELVLLPKLFRRLQKVAPQVRIKCKHLHDRDYQSAMDQNFADLMLGCVLDFGANVYQQSLFKDHEVVVVNADSQIVNQTLSPEAFVALKHCQFRLIETENREIDVELEKVGLQREVVLEVQHELVLPLVLRDNDIVVNLPKRMAQVYAEFLPLAILPLPLETPFFEIKQHWHERDHEDPAHQWFRSEVKALAEDL